MKLTALGSAIRKIVWAEMALTAALGTSVAFAQSQPAAAPPSASDAAAAAPAAASGTAATPATGATQRSQGNVQKLQRFEVTGSLIRSSDKVGFNQVQTVTAQQITDSGYTTVADFMRGISANSANSWSEGQSGNFAAGAAGMALRGLSEKYTLVLVDGQRVAPFAFFSNSVDQFFDLNTLPLNVIDRIEVVKTGAVSQYGSDAVAGVVNIITKHNYHGLQLDGSYGSAINGGGGDGTTKFSMLGGFGNLNSDRFNVTAAASYYKDNGFTMADRDSTRNQDFTNRPGGFNTMPPSFWNVGGAGGAMGVAAPVGNCLGGRTLPAGNNYLGGASIAGQVISGGTVCAFPNAEGMSILPMSERLNAKIHADFKIDDKTTAFADLLESRNTTTTNDGTWSNTVGSPQSPTLVLAQPGGNSLVPFNYTVPASNPYNPFGTATPLIYSFPNTVAEHTYANYYRASAGVKGSFSAHGDWDWSTSISHSQSTVSNVYTNSLNTSVLNNIYQNGTYNFANPAATPNATNGLYMDARNGGISKLDTVDATISTPNLFHLPSGDVGFGLGAQFLHESENLTPGAEYLQGLVVNPDLETVHGQRNIGAAYYQIDIPIIRNLTFSHSGRYDHYSDVGGAYSPRFALRYQPVQQLTLYSSYDRGFRAPTFVENSNSQTLGIQQLQNGTVTTITSGNPNLQPERTKNYNIGFQVAPTRTTDLGLDWYKIHIDKVIGQGGGTTVNDPATGQPLYEVIPYQNLGYLDTTGFETTFRQSLPTHIGTFTLSGDWAYVSTFVLGIPGQAPSNGAGNNFTIMQPFGASFPRWKGNTTLSWDYHKWDAALSWEYTGPYTQAVQPSGTPTAPTGSTPSYSQFNLMVTYKGFKHWTIYGGIDNIFNRTPPFDPIWASSSLNQIGYDQSLYTYIGRFAQIGATYKF